MAKCNPIIEEKGTINPTQLKVLRKWEAQMNSESLGDFRKDISSFFGFTISYWPITKFTSDFFTLKI